MRRCIYPLVGSHISMRVQPNLIIGTLLILSSCATDKRPSDYGPLEIPDPIEIPDPKLVDYNSDNLIVMRAVEKARGYLEQHEKGTNMTEFYLQKVEVKADTIVLMINHADYYVEVAYQKAGEERMKRQEENGDTLILLYVPPTGNYSGMDRTILYLIKQDSIIDILYQ